jgi:hypothetical protein
MIWSQPWQIVCETPISKKTHHKKRTGRVAQGIDPDFKPQYWKNKKQKQPLNVKKLNKMRELKVWVLFWFSSLYNIVDALGPFAGCETQQICRNPDSPDQPTSDTSSNWEAHLHLQSSLRSAAFLNLCEIPPIPLKGGQCESPALVFYLGPTGFSAWEVSSAIQVRGSVEQQAGRATVTLVGLSAVHTSGLQGSHLLTVSDYIFPTAQASCLEVGHWGYSEEQLGTLSYFSELT